MTFCSSLWIPTARMACSPAGWLYALPEEPGEIVDDALQVLLLAARRTEAGRHDATAARAEVDAAASCRAGRNDRSANGWRPPAGLPAGACGGPPGRRLVRLRQPNITTGNNGSSTDHCSSEGSPRPRPRSLRSETRGSSHFQNTAWASARQGGFHVTG